MGTENHHFYTTVVIIATSRICQWMLKLLDESLRIGDVHDPERKGKTEKQSQFEKRLRRKDN